MIYVSRLIQLNETNPLSLCGSSTCIQIKVEQQTCPAKPPWIKRLSTSSHIYSASAFHSFSYMYPNKPNSVPIYRYVLLSRDNQCREVDRYFAPVLPFLFSELALVHDPPPYSDRYLRETRGGVPRDVMFISSSLDFVCPRRCSSSVGGKSRSSPLLGGLAVWEWNSEVIFLISFSRRFSCSS